MKIVFVVQSPFSVNMSSRSLAISFIRPELFFLAQHFKPKYARYSVTSVGQFGGCRINLCHQRFFFICIVHLCNVPNHKCQDCNSRRVPVLHELRVFIHIPKRAFGFGVEECSISRAFGQESTKAKVSKFDVEVGVKKVCML